MLNLKKTAVAVLAFGSSAVFAGTMGPVCAPGNVTVPCASQAWDFGGQALYLKPSYSGYQYYGTTTTITDTATGTSVVEGFNQTPYNWAWGFKLEGSYHFSTGNDLNLNWYHIDHSTNNTYLGFVDTFVDGVAGDSIDALGVGSTTKWDAVNLEFGQHSHFGEWKNIRFHGGVQWARIQGNANFTAAGITADAVDFPLALVSANAQSKFNGFGPRVGADYLYNWGNGFAMYANGATTLLVGSQSFNNSAFIDVTTVDPLVPTLAYANNGSATAIVPALEAKLGVKYTYAMAQGDLSLDAGWMWVNYFNALSNGNPSVDALSSAVAGSTVQTNFAVQGPFIGLKWIGNVA